MAEKAHRRAGRVRIGLSGWSYASWKESFYEGVKQADWLSHAASRFPTLEANATFYRGQSEKTMRRWHDRTPDDFLFTIKAHRILTHRFRLRDPNNSIARQRDSAKPLGRKLGCVLWQLPETYKADLKRLDSFLKLLRAWRGPTHVMEFRHESWFTDETAGILEGAGAANCISHASEWPMWERSTGPLTYVRLHGAPRTYASAYGPRKLADWAKRVKRWRRRGDVFVYFDNDARAAAPRDATTLTRLVAGAKR